MVVEAPAALDEIVRLLGHHALERVTRGHERRAHVGAALGQPARQHESVPAVVPPAAHHGDAEAVQVAEVPLHGGQCSGARALHEQRHRHVEVPRGARIDLAHLAGGEHRQAGARHREPALRSIVSPAFRRSTISSSSRMSSRSKSAPDSRVPNVSP